MYDYSRYARDVYRSRPTMRILFFTPCAGLGGSDMMLLHLLEQLDPKEYQPHVLYRYQGPLFPGLWKDMPTSGLPPANSLWGKFRRRLFPSSLPPQ